MFDKCPVGHLTHPAMVWERNKSNDLLLKLNCLFCAKHIEIVRYIVQSSLRAQIPIVNIPGPGAGRDHRPSAPSSPGPAVRRHGEIKKFCQLWRFGINYGEREAQWKLLYTLWLKILCRIWMLIHIPAFKLWLVISIFLCIQDSQLS